MCVLVNTNCNSHVVITKFYQACKFELKMRSTRRDSSRGSWRVSPEVFDTFQPETLHHAHENRPFLRLVQVAVISGGAFRRDVWSPVLARAYVCLCVRAHACVLWMWLTFWRKYADCVAKEITAFISTRGVSACNTTSVCWTTHDLIWSCISLFGSWRSSRNVPSFNSNFTFKSGSNSCSLYCSLTISGWSTDSIWGITSLTLSPVKMLLPMMMTCIARK